ncbi:hypothetical protein KJZ61_01990 [Candidatus Dependentiae bacterium]|nr:hypothetical protein [Candidatus Dependentiae bacterium]
MVQKFLFKTMVICTFLASIGTPAEARQALARRTSMQTRQGLNLNRKTVTVQPNIGKVTPIHQVSTPQPDPKLQTELPVPNKQRKQVRFKDQDTKNETVNPNQLASKKSRYSEGMLAAAWDGMSSKIMGLPWFIATSLAHKALSRFTRPGYQAIEQEPSLKNYALGIVLHTVETALITSTLQTLTAKLFADEEKMPSTPQLLATFFTRNLGYLPERASSRLAAIRNAVIRTASKTIASSVIPG